MSFAKLRILLALVVVSASIFAFSGSAWAVSNEATTTVGVTYHATAGGGQEHFAAGTTRGEIYSWIKANVVRPSYKPSATSFTVKVGSKVFKLKATEIAKIIPSKISFNYAAMADAAFSAKNGAHFTPGDYIRQSVTSSRHSNLIKKAKSIAYDRKRKATPARYAYSSSKKRMVIVSPKNGYAITTTQVSKAMYSALADWADNGYKGSIKATATRKKIAAPTTSLGKAIVIDKSQRRLYVYNRGKKTKYTYRCTIGSSRFSTPSGFYRIGAKRKNPTWGNPGSAWARNMPRFIGPGPSNPLGLRALNMNNAAGRDTGLRIHGTVRTWEIGRAASHGCIRLTNKNVVKLFGMIPSGTPVIVQP